MGQGACGACVAATMMSPPPGVCWAPPRRRRLCCSWPPHRLVPAYAAASVQAAPAGRSLTLTVSPEVHGAACWAASGAGGGCSSCCCTCCSCCCSCCAGSSPAGPARCSASSRWSRHPLPVNVAHRKAAVASPGSSERIAKLWRQLPSASCRAPNAGGMGRVPSRLRRTSAAPGAEKEASAGSEADEGRERGRRCAHAPLGA